MIVQCPQCSTRFRLDPSRLSDRGARVTCSVCSHGFVVRSSDDVEELDPFASTSVDHAPMTFTPAPSSFDSETTTNEALSSFDFGGSPHEAKTAVHMVPSGRRDPAGARRPAAFDDMQTLVDPPSRGGGMTLDDVSAAVSRELPMESTARFPMTPPPSQAIGDDFLNIDISQDDDEAMALGDDDVMSIDDDDVVAIDDEPTVDHMAMHMPREPSAPQPMAAEGSRGNTAVVRTPSLADPNRSQQGVSSIGIPVPLFSQPMDQATTSVIQVPSIVRPDNEALRQNAMLSAGGATFVGRIDPALLKATISQNDEPELMMSGGLASDGTYMPPQETRPAITAHLEGPTDVHSLQLAEEGTRRAPNPLEAGLGERPDERQRRATTPIEVQGSNRVMRVVTTFGLSLVLLALAVFALVRSGQLDTEVLRDPERIVKGDAVIEGATGLLGVQPLSMRSVLYPTAHGKILVFTGEVKNTSLQPVTNLEVVAEVRKQDGTVLAEAREPLGLALTVAELSRLETPEAAHRAFASKSPTPITIEPGERVPFMVVVSPAPRELRSGRHVVRLVQATPAPQVTAPALPAPAPAPAAAPTQQPAEITAPTDGDRDALDESKGKGKAKRTKMKRKARDANDAPSEPAEQ